jgi:hypothetical protein
MTVSRAASKVSHGLEHEEIEVLMDKYDANHDGTYDKDEVKRIVTDLQKFDADYADAKQETKHAKAKVTFVLVGAAVTICAFFGMFFVLMIWANETSKDQHPNHVDGQVEVVLQTDDGDVISTGIASEDGSRYTIASSSLSSALAKPDLQEAYMLDTLSNAQLSQLTTLSIDTSPSHDGTEFTVYRVSTMKVERPKPGFSGKENPPTVIVSTDSGHTIPCTEHVAVTPPPLPPPPSPPAAEPRKI